MWNATAFGITVGCVLVGIPFGLIGGSAEPNSIRAKVFSSLFLIAILLGIGSLLVAVVPFIFSNLPSPNPCPNPENCDPSNQFP